MKNLLKLYQIVFGILLLSLCASLQALADVIEVRAAEVSAYPGQQVTVPVTVSNFQAITYFSLTVGWDTTVVSTPTVTTAIPGLIVSIHDMRVHVRYDTSYPALALNDGAELFNITFSAIGAIGQSTPVDVTVHSLFVNSIPTPDGLGVDGSVTIMQEPVVPLTDTLIVQAAQELAYQNDIINEYVTVSNFNAVTSFDILVEWDSTVVTLLQPIFSNLFQFIQTNNSLRLIYAGPAITLPDKDPLIILTFTVIGSSGQSTPVEITMNSLTADSSPPTLAVDGSVTIMQEPVVPLVETLIVQAPHVSAYPSQTISVPVTVTDFNSVTQFDISVEWDTTVVSYVNVASASTDFLIANNYLDNGVRITYLNSAPISISDGRELFNITFETIGAIGQSSPVDITIISLTADSAPVTLAIDGSVTIIPEPVILNVGNGNGNVNDEVLIPLTVENYTNVTLFEVPLQWDTTVVEFLGAEDILADFGIFNFNFNSIMIFSIYSDVESSYPDGTLLANLRFRLKMAGGRSDITFFIGEDVHVSGIEWPLQVNGGSITINEVMPMIASEISSGAELPSPQVEERSSVSVFPNPSNDFIEVKTINENAIVTVAIFDQQGNLIETALKKTAKNGTFQYDLRNLRKGNYILKMSEGESQWIVRFIKE